MDDKINGIESKKVLLFGINENTDEVITILNKNYSNLKKVYKKLNKSKSSILTSDICKKVLTYYDVANSVYKLLKSDKHQITINWIKFKRIEKSCNKIITLFHKIQMLQNDNIKKLGGLSSVGSKEKLFYKRRFSEDWANVITLRLV